MEMSPGASPLESRHPQRVNQLESDDHLLAPLQPSGPSVLLSKHETVFVQAGADTVCHLPDDTAVLETAALARLGELDPGGASRLIERVLEAFRVSVARLRPQFNAARAGGDLSTIRLVAHTLKSSTASIGALQVSHLCAQIETAIRVESHHDLTEPLNAFDAALDRALQAVEVFLQSRV